MTDDMDELGPVSYLVVEFPAGADNFTDEMAVELAELHESGMIRLLDLLVMHKCHDGSVVAYEVDDPELDEVSEFVELEAEIAEILAAGDIAHLAAAITPESTAGVVVWENSWAAPFACLAQRAGGQVVATGTIPIQSIAASFEAESGPGAEAGDTSPRPARSVRQSVIGAPAARSVAALGTATVVALGVDRRQDRRAERHHDHADRGDARAPARVTTRPPP